MSKSTRGGSGISTSTPREVACHPSCDKSIPIPSSAPQESLTRLQQSPRKFTHRLGHDTKKPHPFPPHAAPNPNRIPARIKATIQEWQNSRFTNRSADFNDDGGCTVLRFRCHTSASGHAQPRELARRAVPHATGAAAVL